MSATLYVMPRVFANRTAPRRDTRQRSGSARAAEGAENCVLDLAEKEEGFAFVVEESDLVGPPGARRAGLPARAERDHRRVTLYERAPARALRANDPVEPSAPKIDRPSTIATPAAV
jgi:hypothetical protein